jgi:hypothetical protein
MIKNICLARKMLYYFSPLNPFMGKGKDPNPYADPHMYPDPHPYPYPHPDPYPHPYPHPDPCL